MTNPAVKRGDVILVLFPHSNLRTARPRPALVVQADHIETELPQVIVAMITSRMFRANRPSRAVGPAVMSLMVNAISERNTSN